MCDYFLICALKYLIVAIFTFREIDGKTYVGEVKEKEKAKKQYEAAVSSGQTAGLVKWVTLAKCSFECSGVLNCLNNCGMNC